MREAVDGVSRELACRGNEKGSAWEDRDKEGNRDWLAWYRHILAVRRADIWPCMRMLTGGEACYFVQGPQAVTVQWLCSGGPLLRLNANLADRPCAGFPVNAGREIWVEGERQGSGVLQPWCVQWSILRE